MGNCHWSCCHCNKDEKVDETNAAAEEIEIVDARNVAKKLFESNIGVAAIALYTLRSKDASIINFSKGDKLVIEDESDPDWYLVHHINDTRKGFAPKNYLVLDPVVGTEEWFFGNINRAEAERMLLQPENEDGAFLVRNSHLADTYAISVRDTQSNTKDVVVKHYKIRSLDHGGYFVSPEEIFPSIKQLILHHSEAANGLCRKLGMVCPKPRPHVPGPSPTADDEYEVPFRSLSLDRLIGRGHFGDVYSGYLHGSVEVAIKRIADRQLTQENYLQEVIVLKKIRHPAIVRLYAVSTEGDCFYIVMELLRNGNLKTYLTSSHGQSLRLPSLVNISAQIASGMRYLESHQLIHRDLAARNVLVGEKDIVKLCDFGLARIIDEGPYVGKGGKLPVKWTAPEAYDTQIFNIKSDVWSFGILLYEIFTHGGTPYPDMTNKEAWNKIMKYDYRMPKPNDPECSEAIYNTMLFCWKKEPESRPTFEYLYHFFTDYYTSSEHSYKEAR